MKVLQVVFLILISMNINLISAGTQSIHAIGRLMCRGKPAPYAQIQLVNSRGEKENIPIGDLVFSDPDGYFDVYGSMHQFYDIPAQLHVWHECFYDIGVHHGSCKSLLKLDIPKEFVNDSKLPKITWNSGVINLEIGVLGQDLEKCDQE
uniref:Transthyretin-like family protein n=1 Tax=Caenorhabditis tropicalis TaxID=1561998 RepID=A0A1I7TCB3_9PELO